MDLSLLLAVLFIRTNVNANEIYTYLICVYVKKTTLNICYFHMLIFIRQ
jgi:hypothetical protein